MWFPRRSALVEQAFTTGPSPSSRPASSSAWHNLSENPWSLSSLEAALRRGRARVPRRPIRPGGRAHGGAAYDELGASRADPKTEPWSRRCLLNELLGQPAVRA